MVLKTTHIVFSCDLIAQRREALCFPSFAAVELRGSLEERQKIKHEARGCKGVPYTPKSTPCTLKLTPFLPIFGSFAPPRFYLWLLVLAENYLPR